jgi:transcriptional regulator GlxA family with amidase domain
LAETVEFSALRHRADLVILARMERKIVFLVMPGCVLLDLAGPLEVFTIAQKLAPAGQKRYRTELVAPRGDRVLTSSGMEICVPRTIGDFRGAIDTLIVVGALGIREGLRDRGTIRWLRNAANRSKRVAAVCGATFYLAEAGLLDGRRATSHWAVCSRLQRHYPAVRVEEDPIFVSDGKFWTSAGVTSGIDLALAMVAADHGRQVALEVARWIVVFLQRPGGQSQFSVQLAAQVAQREPFQELAQYVADHLDGDLSVPKLARRAGMSERNFARAFRREIGATPRSYVERARLEAARRALEETAEPIEAVATVAGFGTVESLERAFQRQLRITPRAYRHHFQVPCRTT